MLDECTITTIDNPFNPFEQFASWWQFDVEKGYYSCSRLARILTQNDVSFDDMTQLEMNAAVEAAIDQLIELDFTGTYVKVFRKARETAATN